MLGFKLPFYSSPTLLLSLGLSARVLHHLVTSRPQIIHVSSPGLLVFAATMYAKLLRIPLVVSYHTHIPEYIPKYTWKELVHPMWSIIRWCTRASDLTLVTSAAMKVGPCSWWWVCGFEKEGWPACHGERGEMPQGWVLLGFIFIHVHVCMCTQLARAAGEAPSGVFKDSTRSPCNSCT